MLKKTAMLLLLVSMSIRAEQQCTEVQIQLGTCKKLVQDLDKDNLLLKQKIGTLIEQRDDAEKRLEKATEPSIIPTWGWFLVGAGAGVGTVLVIRGGK